MNTHNGWANRKTWNVALWVNNDDRLYHATIEYVQQAARQATRPTWSELVARLGLEGRRTPDGIAWDDRELDCAALDEMLWEMRLHH